MFNFFNKKKHAYQNQEKVDLVVNEIKSFIGDVFSTLKNFTEFKILAIGEHSKGSGTIQVWYVFFSPYQERDEYPMGDYQHRALNKLKINEYFSFKIMYYGTDDDGDFIGFTKEFNGQDGAIALEYLCEEIEKQRIESKTIEIPTEARQ